MPDVMGQQCRLTSRDNHRQTVRTGRLVCDSPAGKATPPGWWVLWDGDDRPTWAPSRDVSLRGQDGRWETPPTDLEAVFRAVPR